ncbi:hypothetical protein D4764_0220190 [Takifugu flavidus]|uniref:Uncharacterized protein n=1 Tax=Takifugu flavidus TaxID=433684 RepID=A0A5C6MCX3_9TELE|nr:hypothetical protein D4764_0220190 [Takifugu flavidus]
MLESLCTLITALTCVSAVTVLTQKPTVVSLSRGESVTIDCNWELVLMLVTGINRFGGVPQLYDLTGVAAGVLSHGSGFLVSKIHFYSSVTSDIV